MKSTKNETKKKHYGKEIAILGEMIEKIPPANNPANAIMDGYREGENSMRKKILETLRQKLDFRL